jgi:hypothetical protein
MPETTTKTKTDFERNEMAMLFGLVTSAYIAKSNGYSFHEFMRAVMLSWETEKSDPLPRAASPEAPQEHSK